MNVVAEECRRALHPSLLSFSFNLENSYHGQLRFPKRSLPLLFFRLFAVRESFHRFRERRKGRHFDRTGILSRFRLRLKRFVIGIDAVIEIIRIECFGGP